jgi:hypothetical protein
MPDPISTAVWRNWIEVNPKTAAGLGLAEGDGVTTGALSLVFEAMDTPATMFPSSGPSEATGWYWGATDYDVSMCPNITTSGTEAALSDDSYVSVAMGINFEFFGTAYTSTWVSSNGLVSFGGSYGISSRKLFITRIENGIVNV